MIDYSKIPTFELTKTAEKIMGLANKSTRRQFWLDELLPIDAELDTRTPTEQFRTLIDEAGQPVGFERV